MTGDKAVSVTLDDVLKAQEESAEAKSQEPAPAKQEPTPQGQETPATPSLRTVTFEGRREDISPDREEELLQKGLLLGRKEREWAEERAAREARETDLYRRYQEIAQNPTVQELLKRETQTVLDPEDPVHREILTLRHAMSERDVRDAERDRMRIAERAVLNFQAQYRDVEPETVALMRPLVERLREGDNGTILETAYKAALYDNMTANGDKTKEAVAKAAVLAQKANDKQAAHAASAARGGASVRPVKRDVRKMTPEERDAYADEVMKNPDAYLPESLR